MIDSILTSAGIPARRTRFKKPPAADSYIVWFDTVTLVGPDVAPWMLREHSITIELYEYKIDETVEAALEAALNGAGVEWACGDREWIDASQLYQVIYTFKYHEKRR